MDLVSKVALFQEALSRKLARELGVSIAFVEAMAGFDVKPDKAKLAFRWFLRLSARERMIFMKDMLRDAARLRAKKLGGRVEDRALGQEVVRMLLASWRAAKRRADLEGVLVQTAASYAGMLIENAEGDLALALASAAHEPGVFFDNVRTHLESATGTSETKEVTEKKVAAIP